MNDNLADCDEASEDSGSYYLVIGPIEKNLDGFSAEDRKEWLEDDGWRNVKIKWVELEEK